MGVMGHVPPIILLGAILPIIDGLVTNLRQFLCVLSVQNIFVVTVHMR